MKIRYQKLILILCWIAIPMLLVGCKKDAKDDFVLVKGGTFLNQYSAAENIDSTVEDFYISRFEVTQKEWTEVMGNNPSQFIGENRPVEMVSWYDCIEYCNKRSELEGLSLYYNIDKNVIDATNQSEYDTAKWTVTTNESSNGYRLPTAVEWEYAASGGQLSKGHVYSGSDDINDVGWYWKNSGKEILTGDWEWSRIQSNENQTHNVGEKAANELGLYDMSGNVREWCFDWYVGDDVPSNSTKVWHGGGWIGDSKACDITYCGKFEANGYGADQGFRICKNVS